ncbi:MAG: efflux RND transporter periplasmic adaptor subunit [Armatimonadota bacterium]
MPNLKIVIPIALAAAVAAFAWTRLRPESVSVARVETGRVVEVVYATGTVRPDTETKLAAEVTGRIVALLVDEGDRVALGQAVARLDDTEAKIRLREAEYRVETARARLEQAGAPTDPLNVRQVEAQVRAAQARARAAAERTDGARRRVETLRDSARASDSAVESAEAKARAMRSSARAARQEVDVAQERVDAARAEAAQAAASAASARDLAQRYGELLREGAISERMTVEARRAAEAAEAATRAARNRVSAAVQGVESARASADAAAAQADDADAAVRTARANAEAARAQVREAAETISELQRSSEAAGDDLAAVRSQLAQARRGPRSVDVEPLRTEVRTAQAAAAQAREDLAKYTVLSPVTGVVTERPVDPGDYVISGSRLFTVANEQRMFIEAEVDEADIAGVRRGAEARFQVDAIPDRTYTGHVTRIADAADRTTKTYRVEVRELSATDGLRIGMTADVNIQGRVTERALLLPVAALRSENGVSVVWVVDPSGRAQRREVRTQAKDATSVQVLSGLSAGERVVLNPPDGLEAGDRVEVRER